MAKRKNARQGRRRSGAKKQRLFKGFGALPSLSTYNASVKGLDVLAGVGVGLIGVIAVKYVRSKLEGMVDDKGVPTATAKYFKELPAWSLALTPAIGGILGGVAAYAVSKKFMGGARGPGHLIGAAFAGITLSADVLIKSNLATSTKKDAAGKDIPGLLHFYNGIEDFGALVPDSTFGALQADYGRYGALRSDYAGYEGRNEIETALGY